MNQYDKVFLLIITIINMNDDYSRDHKNNKIDRLV